MHEKHIRDILESLKEKALELMSKRHGIKDAILVDAAHDTLGTTNEPVFRFRAVGAAQANELHHEVVLGASGEELNLEEIGNREGSKLFPVTVGAASGTTGFGGVPAAGGFTISPTENKLTLKQGDTLNETVTVAIPANAGATKADVYFLADTTGSMEKILGAVQGGAANILNTLSGLGLDIAFGVGNYKDFPINPSAGSPYVFQHQQNPTNVAAQVAAAINAWHANGGGDLPEAQLHAMHKLAEPPGGPIGWRAASKRIIVWFGDAPGHDPVCKAISGEPADTTEASVIAELQTEKITVLAISTSSPGLDGDPKPPGTGNYTAVCGAPGGNPGQGTHIANATGGKFVSPIDPAYIGQTIIDLVKGAVAALKNVKLVPAGDIAPFVTSISPAAGYGPLPGDKPHTLTFEVVFTGVIPCKDTAQVFTGTLNVVADGAVVAQKRVEITVPACEVKTTTYSYSVKFVCGVQSECDCACSSVRPGSYATEINIYNHNNKEVAIAKLVVPVVLAGAPAGREPKVVHRRAEDKIVLPPRTATMDDCCRISERLFGAAPHSPMPITIGFLEIVSPAELIITAVYTVTGANSGSVNIDVEQIEPKLIRS